MPYSPLDERKRKSILDIVKKDLLTPRGLRTLTPKHPDYQGFCSGNQNDRVFAAFNGSAWPWLLGHFSEGYLRVHGKSGISLVRSLYLGFEDELRKQGIGSVPELFDGNPPYSPGGAISFAPSTAELLRMKALMDEFESLEIT